MTAIDEKTLAYLLSPSRSGLDPSLFVPLLRLLAEGEPVTIAELATASGRSENTVRRGLSSVPDAEYDDDGRILGLALTLRPTPHRFTVAGRAGSSCSMIATPAGSTAYNYSAHGPILPIGSDVLALTAVIFAAPAFASSHKEAPEMTPAGGCEAAAAEKKLATSERRGASFEASSSACIIWIEAQSMRSGTSACRWRRAVSSGTTTLLPSTPP